MGILDWLLGNKSKYSEVKDAGIEKGEVKKKGKVKPKKKVPFRKESKNLITAAERGHTKTVERLLTKGADVNAKDEDGWTALMWAAQDEHTEIVKMLLSKGADVNAKDEDGWTALMSAAGYGRTKIVKMLLSKGARVNAKKGGWTALMWAAQDGHTKIVRLLKQAGAKGSLEEETEPLIMLLVKAYQWGESHRFPLHSKYPQYKRIHSIGERLCREGGIKRMRRVFDAVNARRIPIGDMMSIASFLEYFWDGIGPWRA